MKKYWIICLLVVLAMTACEHKEEGTTPVQENPAQDDSDFSDGAFTQDSYITVYFDPDILELRSMTVSSGDFLLFHLRGEDFWHSSSDPEEQARFNEYADRYNDHGYNNKTIFNGTVGEAITAIRATSTVDFDALHPAGALLNDVIIVNAVTFYPFISNRYPESWGSDQRRSAIHLLLSELTPEKMTLWETEGYFELAATPDPTLEELPLRFEFDFENGRTLAAETVMNLVSK